MRCELRLQFMHSTGMSISFGQYEHTVNFDTHFSSFTWWDDTKHIQKIIYKD